MTRYALSPGEPNESHTGRTYTAILRCDDCGEEWECRVEESWGAVTFLEDKPCPGCGSDSAEVVGEAGDYDPEGE